MSFFKALVYAGNVDSSSTRIPPTASNRKKLALERVKAIVDEERLGIDKSNSTSASTEEDDEPLDIYDEDVCDKVEAEGTKAKKIKSAAIEEQASSSVRTANLKARTKGNKKKGAVTKQAKKRRTK